MPSVLMVVTGSDVWTFADGEKHPCGYWPEELVAPRRVFGEAGLDLTIATSGGVKPTPDEAGFMPEMNIGSAAAGRDLRDYIASIDDQPSSPAVLEDIDAAGYDIVFVPGGHGPMEGARFENADPWQARVVADRNLYTGQNPASSKPLAERLVAAVQGS
jgi:putative intracellular protease/amidase